MPLGCGSNGDLALPLSHQSPGKLEVGVGWGEEVWRDCSLLAAPAAFMGLQPAWSHRAVHLA